MKITFLGAAHEVTGSCTLIEALGKRIIVDCGMEQGADIYKNCDLPVAPNEIDAVCLTHAHIDHSGKLPALVAEGYSGPIYSTEATFRLCNIMLRDSAHIQEFEAEWRNRKGRRAGREPYVPLYTMKDAEKTLSLYKYTSYGNPLTIFDGIKIEFFDAGHLLGSSSIRLSITEKGKETSILFSGDLGNVSRPLIRDPQVPPGADYVVIESTYGDRLHGERPDYALRLTQILQDTFDRGGNVVIPSFAIGRTQEILYLLRGIKEKGAVEGHNGFEVYVDSPLAVEATAIYADKLTDYYDAETLELLNNGIDPIGFKGLNLSLTQDDSRAINFNPSPKVILSASGMCEAGRIRHHLKHNLWRSDSTVLFVGYQAEGTVGRRLVDGEKTVKLFGETVTVNAKIEALAGISGHADKNMLLSWLEGMEKKPCKVFVNHGDDSVTDSFAKSITDTLGIEAVAPYSGDEYDLQTGVCIAKGKIIKISKTAYKTKRAKDVFERLVAAGNRLLKVIMKQQGAPNKDVARFTEEINNLADRYDKK